MQRTSATNTIDLGGGRLGHRDRNTASGIPGTGLQAGFFNNLQEELAAIVEGVGLSLNGADMDQVWQSLGRLTGRQLQTVTASATLTADSGTVLVSAAAGNVTITLPAAAALAGTVAGVAVVRSQQLTLMRTDTTANTVTIQRAGSDKLGAAGTATNYLLGVSERLRILSDGVDAWHLASCNLLGRRRHIMSSSGDFTVPAFVERIAVRVKGGGGGGGGCPANGSAGGGGEGGTAEGDLVVTPGAVMSGVVGAAGAAGTASGDGGNGGNTTFGGLTGGGGYGGLSTGTGTPAGGQGGTASGGLLNHPGGYGGDGIPGTGSALVAGNGGGSGGRGAVGGGAPTAGQAPGSGGSGAYGTSAAPGGAGKAGEIEIEY